MTNLWRFCYRVGDNPHRPLLFGCLLLALLITLSVGLAVASSDEATADLSRFQRTALFLQTADPAFRADFADATLQELGAVLLAEIDLVEGELVAGPGQQKLRGWVAAVHQYLGELALLRKDIAQGYDVQLSIGAGNELEVWVDQRAIIATHPRPGHQALLEQAILADFCSSHECEKFTAPPEPPEATPIPVSRADVRPVWNFGPDGPVCEHRQLSVSFTNNSGLARYRLLCQQFLHEAVRLVDEIAWQRRHGVKVDWPALAVNSSPGRPEHVVRLNAAGDSVLITIPVIRGTNGLLELLVPWLRAEVEGDASTGLALKATELGWEARTPVTE